jgi:hypothetical protein
MSLDALRQSLEDQRRHDLHDWLDRTHPRLTREQRQAWQGELEANLVASPLFKPLTPDVPDEEVSISLSSDDEDDPQPLLSTVELEDDEDEDDEEDEEYFKEDVDDSTGTYPKPLRWQPLHHLKDLKPTADAILAQPVDRELLLEFWSGQRSINDLWSRPAGHVQLAVAKTVLAMALFSPKVYTRFFLPAPDRPHKKAFDWLRANAAFVKMMLKRPLLEPATTRQQRVQQPLLDSALALMERLYETSRGEHCCPVAAFSITQAWPFPVLADRLAELFDLCSALRVRLTLQCHQHCFQSEEDWPCGTLLKVDADDASLQTVLDDIEASLRHDYARVACPRACTALDPDHRPLQLTAISFGQPELLVFTAADAVRGIAPDALLAAPTLLLLDGARYDLLLAIAVRDDDHDVRTVCWHPQCEEVVLPGLYPEERWACAVYVAARAASVPPSSF